MSPLYVVIGFMLCLKTVYSNRDEEVRDIFDCLHGKDWSELLNYNLTQFWSPFSPERNNTKIYLHFQNFNRSYILHGYPTTVFGTEVVEESGFVKNQLNFYNKVVPLLKQLRQEFDDNNEQFWITLEGLKNGVFIYEDVENKGYTNPNRFEGLDLKQCQVALENLAKFHAMTAVLFDRGLLIKDDFDKSIYERSQKSRSLPFYSDLIVERFTESIEKAWGENMTEYANYVQKRLKNVTIQLDTIHKRDKNGFNVLNHGGYMILEMLFTKDPVKMRMKAAMNFFYNSPILDLHKFLGSSPNVHIMINKKYELFDYYYEKLIENLIKFDYKKSHPEYKKLKTDYERTINMSLMESISGLQYVLRDPNEKYELMETFKKSWNQNTTLFNPMLMYGQKYIKNMKIILENETK